MKWASAASAAVGLEAAVKEAGAALARALAGEEPHLVMAFAAPAYGEAERLHALLAPWIGEALLVGCGAGGVIGGGVELEQRPGLALVAASLPGVELTPFHLAARALPTGDDAGAWRRLIGVAAEETRAFVLLVDPFTFDGQALASGLDRGYPDAVKVGGLASGAGPGEAPLWLGREVYDAGAVGVALAGPLAVEAIVAQGCRPIGRPMFVTAADGNLLRELNRRPALAVLRELYDGLDERDRALFRHSLFFGLVMDEARQEHRLGDFLIRNVLGRVADAEAIAVGAPLRDLQVVQFHLRDARTSAEELDALLARRAAAGGPRPAGALLFSCLGRGVGLYGEPDHDSRLFARHLGPIPLGGFFGNGEIGPVQHRTWVHGYTSAFALFSSTRA